MPGTEYALSVDLGSGGPKVGLISFEGEIAWHGFLPIDTRYSDGGGAEQDAEEWWSAIVSLAHEAIASHEVPAGQIVAVACTGQWASTVPVDKRGLPTAPCAMWSDTRGRERARAAIGGPLFGYSPSAALTWIRKTGGAPSTSGADPAGHILFFENELAEVARATRWYLEPVDYLSMRLTGRAVASPASMSAAWLTDNRHPGALAYDPDLVGRLGIPPEKLPPLVPTGSVVGPVSEAVARRIGIDAGIPVVTGVPDLHSAAVGSGGVLEHEAHIAISTTSWVSCPVAAKKTDPLHQIATVPGLTSDRYLIANNHESGGACLAWLARVLFEGPPDFTALGQLAARAPAGSGGVIFTPWLAGERSPVEDRHARGGFHNISLSTSRADLARAVLEGVAYNSRWLFDYVERFAGGRLEPVRLIGGGANSDLWCQIHADVLGRRIEQVAQPTLANLRGAGLFAGMALGKVSRGSLRGRIPVKATYSPSADAGAYRRLYAEFPKLYSAQKAMFRRLNRRAET